MFVERYYCELETIQIIGEFSILWCRFEQVFFGAKAFPGKVEEYSDSIVQSEENKQLYSSLKQAATDYLLSIDEGTIRSRIYSEENKGNENRRMHIYRFLNDESLDWVGCLLFIERIRDNLFHGLKDVYSLNHQKEMFIAICKLLDYFLKEVHM